MILVPAITKKHAAAALLLLAGIVAGLFIYRSKTPAQLRMAVLPPASAPESAVTMSDYQIAAAAAVKGFAFGDRGAVSAVFNRLAALRIPAEGKTAHLEITTAIFSYSQALEKGDALGADAALARIKIFAKNNPWLQLSLAN